MKKVWSAFPSVHNHFEYVWVNSKIFGAFVNFVCTVPHKNNPQKTTYFFYKNKEFMKTAVECIFYAFLHLNDKIQALYYFSLIWSVTFIYLIYLMIQKFNIRE